MLLLLGHSLRPLLASPSEPFNGLFCVKPGFSWSPADRRAFFAALSFWNIQGTFLVLWSAFPYLGGMSSRIYILPGSVCHCFQIKARRRSTAFMTLEGLSGTFWACWARERSQYLHFHLPAVRGWLPLVANWWLAVPDQEAHGWGERHRGGPSSIILSFSARLMTQGGKRVQQSQLRCFRFICVNVLARRFLDHAIVLLKYKHANSCKLSKVR